MHIFLSVGEPSGDIHGANLIRSLQQHFPQARFVGFGGDHMEAAGCRLLYPLCQLAVMWFLRVLANFHKFLALISETDRYFRHHRPDAVVLIDYPGFNWWVARRAHFHGIPVFYFVPPQLWGWAGWRVKKMQRWVDHVLCTLPFEKAWYEERGVHAHYVGHPYFDELPRQQLDTAFMAQQQAAGGPIIGLLPGSRTQEITNNFKTMIRAAVTIHQARPDVRFLVAGFREQHRTMMLARLRSKQLPIEVHVGRTPEIIELSHATIAVSGSVGLELLYRGKPSIVSYLISKFDMKVCNYFKTSQYISLVNLLAGKELYPEFLTDHCQARDIAAIALRWLNEPAVYEELCAELRALRERVAEPGACARAAAYIARELGAASAKRMAA